MSRRRVVCLAALVLLTGTASRVEECAPPPTPPPDAHTQPDWRFGLSQDVVQMPGYVEPHTPGSGAPEEVLLGPDHPVVRLLGPHPDLNRITYVRTHMRGPGRVRPQVVLILVPGFLGGATTFDPLARQLVQRFGGQLEVWAVDRRPNQLEDRLGALHALAGARDPLCQQTPPDPECPIFQGAQFYFADLDRPPYHNFPGPEDKDIDLDGELDPQRPLVDRFGVSRTAITLQQDDVRGFFAYWGVDTYLRDWKKLVEKARARVGRHGLVLLGGHSQGTSWATVFAAYDFDPDPNAVDAGFESLDGLVLIEGGGIGPGNLAKASLAEYEQTVQGIATGQLPAFLESFDGIPLVGLGASGEIAAIAGHFMPDEPSLIQRTPVFGTGLVSLLLGAPATNAAVVGFFLDDDFSPISFFRASMGFSDNGPNTFVPGGLGLAPFYLAGPANDGSGLRSWIDYDDVDETCVDPAVSPGCAIVDNGPPSLPGDPYPKTNGVEREVTSLQEFLLTQFGKANGFEWYFVDRRVSLDFAYGNDSSALVAESVARDGVEGPLVVTQNANVDVPVLAIGASNGLAPEPRSFERYLSSIATPIEDQHVVILEGYAHLDPIDARHSEAADAIGDFVDDLLATTPAGTGRGHHWHDRPPSESWHRTSHWNPPRGR